MTTPSDTTRPASPSRLGHFAVVRLLGEGGMGVVYEARDERLGRSVALKLVHPDDRNPDSRDRLWREAQAAASFSHPNLCQLYDVGEADGKLFLAMELLEGESLGARLERGAMTPAEVVPLGLAMLSALAAMHRRGFIHRDLKPSNVFLTPHGVKLLDFGLTRSSFSNGPGTLDVTQPGILVGTPRYLTPEQVAGKPADARSDLFALGTILFEMLSGRPAFEGDSLASVLHAVIHAEPPALSGSPAVAALDRVIQRALAKQPERRYPNAEAMADDVRGALLHDQTGSTVRAEPITRLIVLPFRVLRPDPDTDFLAFSLPDALSSTLSGLGNLVVRSSLAALSEDGMLDLGSVAERADVDAVLTGTILRAGDQVRVVAQLVEAPRGTVAWSHTAQVSLGDVFQLQDTIAQRILESLSGSFSARDQGALRQDAPRNAEAYELYLRANALSAQSVSQPSVARDLYMRCVELDPGFAPGWARLGRVLRIQASYSNDAGDTLHGRAEEAFRRALEISPDLPVAHHYYTHLEVEVGRASEAMVRLLERIARRGEDPEILAGLVQACRYSGLNEAAVAAYERARRLDPEVRTSASHAFFVLGDYQRAIETNVESPPIIVPGYLALLGREEEALELLRSMESKSMPWVMGEMIGSSIALLSGRHEEALARMREVATKWAPRDPCPRYYIARQLSAAGDPARALEILETTIEDGFLPLPLMRFDPWLDPMRGEPRFQALVRRAEERRRAAERVFFQAEGDRILGVSIPRAA